MEINRRRFLRGGVAAFTVGFAAPGFLSELALAQGAASRNLVVLYLAGGNDSLSTVIPYSDAQYYARRPSIARARRQRAADRRPTAAGTNIGLHPRLTGLKSIFERGRLAIVQRTGYPKQSRSHFLGTDIWSTADPDNPPGAGWLGRYLDTLPPPLDPLVAWNIAARDPAHAADAHGDGPGDSRASAATSTPRPNSGADATYSRQAATRIASHVPVDQPHLSFVSAHGAVRHGHDRPRGPGRAVRGYDHLSDDGLAQAMKAVAGAIVQGIGTKVFWVQTGGFDTHSGQGVVATNGAYYSLMGQIDDALLAFYTDLDNQGALGSTLVVQFSEFGRRISENGSQGTDHGAASVMMVVGGAVRGGLYGTAPNLSATPDNPTLENSGGDVAMENDFRSVYAGVCDRWLGVDSVGDPGRRLPQRQRRHAVSGCSARSPAAARTTRDPGGRGARRRETKAKPPTSPSPRRRPPTARRRARSWPRPTPARSTRWRCPRAGPCGRAACARPSPGRSSRACP